MGILVMLVLVSAVSLTVVVAQQQQTLKQHAASADCKAIGGSYCMVSEANCTVYHLSKMGDAETCNDPSDPNAGYVCCGVVTPTLTVTNSPIQEGGTINFTYSGFAKNEYIGFVSSYRSIRLSPGNGGGTSSLSLGEAVPGKGYTLTAADTDGNTANATFEVVAKTTTNPTSTSCSSFSDSCEVCLGLAQGKSGTNNKPCGWNGSSSNCESGSSSCPSGYSKWNWYSCTTNTCPPSLNTSATSCKHDSDCNDNNPCTLDSCDTSSGVCKHDTTTFNGHFCNTTNTLCCSAGWCDAACGGADSTPSCDSAPAECNDATCTSTCLVSGTETCTLTTLLNHPGEACTKTPATPQPCDRIDCGSTKTCNTNGACEDPTQKNLFACDNQTGPYAGNYQCKGILNGATQCDIASSFEAFTTPSGYTGTTCETNQGCCKQTAPTGTITLAMALTVQDATLPDSLPVNLSLYDFTTGLPVSNVTIAPQTFTNTQTAKGKQYLQDVQIPNLSQGRYTVVARTDNNMIARSAFSVSTSVTTPIVVSPTTLVFGDVNNDNDINTLDYENIFKLCWLKTAVGIDCSAADFNKKGVDQIDYNIFEKGWATWYTEGKNL